MQHSRIEMYDKENIEELRIKASKAEFNVDGAEAWLKVIFHEDVSWEDLLNALPFKLLTGERASFKLHELLNVKISKDGHIMSAEKWREILRSKNINPNSKAKGTVL